MAKPTAIWRLASSSGRTNTWGRCLLTPMSSHITAHQRADKISADIHLVEQTSSRWLKMVLPRENKRVFVGKASNRLRVMRGRNELTARLEGSPESQHKMTNLGRRQKIVGLIPKAKHMAIDVVRSEH